jgi:hypothetical protein
MKVMTNKLTTVKKEKSISQAITEMNPGKARVTQVKIPMSLMQSQLNQQILKVKTHSLWGKRKR